MTITVDHLFEEALCLSSDSRVALAERLIESVEPDKGIFEAQLQVAQRRAHELDSGVVQAIPGEEALARVRDAILGKAQT
jgi:putative addiction module component (TIGR02574 family)